MNIQILPSAQEDLAAGFEFYEAMEAGLGDYFFTCLFADIDSLNFYAGIHRTVHGWKRLLSKRFPYAIYYSIEGETIVVKAVLDCRRNPVWIRRRLK